MRNWVAVVCGLLAAGSAAAQGDASWDNNPATRNWNDPLAWSTDLVPSGVATFGNPGGTAVSPEILAGATATATRAFFTNNGTTASYSVVGGAGSVLALTGTGNTATAATTALTVQGGGTTRINPTLRLSGGGFVFALGGTALELAGPLATAAAGNAVSFRADGTSRVRFLSAAAASLTGTVNLTATVSSNGRYEIGADNALGTGQLTSNGGTGGQFLLYAYDPAGVGNVTRTLANSFVYNNTAGNGPSTIVFGDSAGGGAGSAAAANNSNSLVFTGPATLGAAATPRLITVLINSTQTATTPTPILSTSAVRFTGTVGLRSAGDATTAAAGVRFNNTISATSGRVELLGVVSNGGTAAAGPSNILVGGGGGTAGGRGVALLLSNPANTYTGTTTVESGALIVGANAPATGVGALGNPAAGSETVVLGTATETVTRYLLLSTGGPADVTFGRPVNTLTGTASPPVSVLGTVGGPRTGTFDGTIDVGTANTANPARLILNASEGGLARFTGPIRRSADFTGPVRVLANITLGGFGGTGTVAIGGTQPAGLNAQVGLNTGTLRLEAGTSLDAGGGFFVGGGTAVVNGTLATPTGTGPARVGASFDLNTGNETVTNSGTLAGTGTVSLPVTVLPGGTLAAGAGSAGGVLTAGAAVTFDAGSVLRVTVTPGTPVPAGENTGDSSGPTPGQANTRLAAGSNSIALNSPNLVVDLTGVTLTEYSDYSFVVATGTNITPAGAGPRQVAVGSFTFVGSPLLITDASVFVSADSDRVFVNFTPVPEPATVLLAAGLGLAAVRAVRGRTG